MNLVNAILIEPSGKVSRVQYDSLEALHKLVGGYVELIRLKSLGCYAYLNEDGIDLKLPANDLATRLCRTDLWPWDYIKGNLVVVGPADDDGNDTSVDPELADKFLKLNGG